MTDLTPLEIMILGAISSLGQDAYGVAIKKRLGQLSGRDLMYGTLYNALGQLARKRLISKAEGEPTPERGGRRKIYYRLTPHGSQSLREAHEAERLFWNRLAVLGGIPKP